MYFSIVISKIKGSNVIELAGTVVIKKRKLKANYPTKTKLINHKINNPLCFLFVFGFLVNPKQSA
jgi:hypothetical protein